MGHGLTDEDSRVTYSTVEMAKDSRKIGCSPVIVVTIFARWRRGIPLSEGERGGLIFHFVNKHDYWCFCGCGKVKDGLS